MIKGCFSNGKVEGTGSREYKSGKKLSGVWKSGELVEGKLVQLDGTFYDGQWVNNRP